MLPAESNEEISSVVEGMDKGDRFLVETGPDREPETWDSTNLTWVEIVQVERYRDSPGGVTVARVKTTSAVYNDVEDLTDHTVTITRQWIQDTDGWAIRCHTGHEGREIRGVYPVPVDGDAETVRAMFPEYDARCEQAKQRVQERAREMGYADLDDMSEDAVAELVRELGQ